MVHFSRLQMPQKLTIVCPTIISERKVNASRFKMPQKRGSRDYAMEGVQPDCMEDSLRVAGHARAAKAATAHVDHAVWAPSRVQYNISLGCPMDMQGASRIDIRSRGEWRTWRERQRGDPLVEEREGEGQLHVVVGVVALADPSHCGHHHRDVAVKLTSREQNSKLCSVRAMPMYSESVYV